MPPRRLPAVFFRAAVQNQPGKTKPFWAPPCSNESMWTKRDRSFVAVFARGVAVALGTMLFCGAARSAQRSPISSSAQDAAASQAVEANAPAAASPESNAQGSDLFSKLVERNQQRTRQLEQYAGTRTYELRNDRGELSAREVVRMEFRAPGTKTFQTVSSEGSKWIRKFVFKGLITSEVEAAAGREHRDSSITPHNYTFRYLGRQQLDGRPCYVVYAIPNRLDKYLFEGLVWIDAQDFAVMKISGHPARNPSFWIKHVEWTRQYGKFGDFWLPVEDDTLVDVRIFGKKQLVIKYQNYAVNQPASAEHQSPANSAADRSGRD
jgi:hypothetical protein